jgi:hypothetical protein
MRALNIIRGISEGFDVCSFALSCTIHAGLQTMALDSACFIITLLINIVLVINYYEINKGIYENVLRFIGVIV